jgi:hypothetical protein
MLTVVILNVVALSVITVSDVMLNVVIKSSMPSLILTSGIMLSAAS